MSQTQLERLYEEAEIFAWMNVNEEWKCALFFLQSWEAADRDKAKFTPDITPLILAAHKDNYEILKILLDRGATLPVPHDLKCGCDTCVTTSAEDSLRYSM